MSTTTTDADLISRVADLEAWRKRLLAKYPGAVPKDSAIAVAVAASFEPTLSSTPKLLATNHNKKLSCSDVENQLRAEMALLPRSKELMMKYEKLYLQALDNYMRSLYPGKIDNLKRRREEFKRIHTASPDVVAAAMFGFAEEIRVMEEKKPKIFDWDEYFLDRELYDYCVNHIFIEKMIF